MRNSTNNSPGPHYYHHPCTRNKGGTRPSTLLTTGSLTRSGPDHRTYPFHLTKTSPICPLAPNPATQPNPPSHHGHSLHPGRRLGWPEPNPATENPGLLFDCPPRLNNSSTSIFTPSYPPYTYSLPCHNIFCLYLVQNKRLNQHQLLIHLVNQSTCFSRHRPPYSFIVRRPSPTIRLYAQMTNYSRANQTGHGLNRHNYCPFRPPQPILLLATLIRYHFYYATKHPLRHNHLATLHPPTYPPPRINHHNHIGTASAHPPSPRPIHPLWA